jgi:hypothetical protein
MAAFEYLTRDPGGRISPMPFRLRTVFSKPGSVGSK